MRFFEINYCKFLIKVIHNKVIHNDKMVIIGILYSTNINV